MHHFGWGIQENQECFIFGRRSSGSFDIRLLDGTKLSAGVSYKKLKLIEKRKSYLIERRNVAIFFMIKSQHILTFTRLRVEVKSERSFAQWNI